MFRREVLEQKSGDRLVGDVSIAVPLRWHLIGLLLAFIIVASAVFLSTARYARVETVAGTVTPDAGVSQIMPSRAGVLTSLVVADGDRVEEGDSLAEVRTEEQSWEEQSATLRIQDAISEQDRSLTAQISNLREASDRQRTQLEAERVILTEAMSDLEAQIGVQNELIDLGRENLASAEDGAERGVIAGRDLQLRREELLSQEQGLLQLEQSLSSQRAELSQVERLLVQLEADMATQIASLESTRSELSRQQLSIGADRSYVLRSPVSGQVTALTIRSGQAVSVETPLMTIIPEGSVLQAELHVPTTAIGFVEVGQNVRLAIDAFPYDRFGTISGRVERVANSAVFSAGTDGQSTPLYPVTVALDSQAITAFGREQSLISGMTLTARILTEERNLFEMLFEPFFAVARR